MAKIKALKPCRLFPLLVILGLAPIQVQGQTTGSGGYYDQSYSQPDLATGHDGHWIVDASDPGPDIPAAGRSLFDLIFSAERNGHTTYEIPFPFPALLQRIRDLLATPEASLKYVRIPLGRSLRREAAAPEYFLYPRIVVSADAEPAEVPGQAGLLLKGRLFLGYQEKSSVLEVISYNPEAGRFEFQEVRNYGPGLKPRVTYARRPLCLSCHQNAGPIFPMEPWRETDANRQVSARLPPVSRASSLKPAYAPRFDDAWAVDYASDRANYLSSSQFLWREGCGSDDATPSVDAIRCRAAMLAAVLQYRLIGLFDQRSHLYRGSFLPVVTRNWHGRWPGGLYIATADIPDRDPFSPTATLIENPLTARPPRAVWSTPTPHLLAGIVYQTADFLTQTDIARIDDHLYRRAIENGVPTSSYRASCAFDRGAGVDSRQIIRFSCTQTDDRKTPGFSATGLVVIDKGRVVDGNIDRLTLPAQPELRFLKLGRAQIDEADGQRTISVRLMEKEGRIGARLLDGTLLELIRFRWPDGPGQTGSEIIRDAQLTTIRNLAPLDDAIEQMIAASATGKIDALSSKPLRRHSILKALHSNLGMAPLRWRHDGASPQPASGSQNNAPARSPLFAPFYRHCSACHGEAQRFPPGFLNGTAAEVLRKLSRCAPQIVLRLDTWNHRSDDRSVSPMPPAHWLSSSGLSEADWRESDSLKALQSAARQLLASAGPAQPAHLSETAQLCTP